MKKLLLLGIICAFSAQLYAMNYFRRSANCAYQGARNKFQSAKNTFNTKRYEFKEYLDSPTHLTKGDVGIGAAAFAVPVGAGYYAAHSNSDYDKFVKAFERYRYVTKSSSYNSNEKRIAELEADVLLGRLTFWQKIKAMYTVFNSELKETS